MLRRAVPYVKVSLQAPQLKGNFSEEDLKPLCEGYMEEEVIFYLAQLPI